MLLTVNQYLWRAPEPDNLVRGLCVNKVCAIISCSVERAPQFHTKCFCVYHSLYRVSGNRLFLEFFNVCVLTGKQIRSFVVGSRCVVFFRSSGHILLCVARGAGVWLIITHQDLCTNVSGGASVRVGTQHGGTEVWVCTSKIQCSTYNYLLVAFLWNQPHVFHNTGCWQAWLCSWFIEDKCAKA